MGDTFAIGVITGLDMRPRKNRDNAILQVDAVLVIATLADTGLWIHQRIGQSQIAPFIIVFIEGEDQKAVVIFSPLIVGIDVLTAASGRRPECSL